MFDLCGCKTFIYLFIYQIRGTWRNFSVQFLILSGALFAFFSLSPPGLRSLPVTGVKNTTKGAHISSFPVSWEADVQRSDA